jgi:hypothetical protein
MHEFSPFAVAANAQDHRSVEMGELARPGDANAWLHALVERVSVRGVVVEDSLHGDALIAKYVDHDVGVTAGPVDVVLVAIGWAHQSSVGNSTAHCWRTFRTNTNGVAANTYRAHCSDVTRTRQNSDPRLFLAGTTESKHGTVKRQSLVESAMTGEGKPLV